VEDYDLPDRIVAIKLYPRLTNLRALQRFIGIVGFYSWFITDYFWKAAVLHVKEERGPVYLVT